MKKKLLMVVLASICVFSLVACGGDKSDNSSANGGAQVQNSGEKDVQVADAIRSALLTTLCDPDVINAGLTVPAAGEYTVSEFVSAMNCEAAKNYLNDILGTDYNTLGAGYKVTFDGKNQITVE